MKRKTKKGPGGAPPSLRDAVNRLAELYGDPKLPSNDVFELILWENVAYLVDDRRRSELFGRLEDHVGLSPEAILAAPAGRLERTIEGGGLDSARRAEKLRRCAALMLEVGRDGLVDRRSLKRFPGIGDPGADWLLLVARRHVALAPESNALRVLLRLGFGREEKDYARTYRSVSAAAADSLPGDHRWVIRARQLLRRHGQELCRRTRPRCEVCPLTSSCRHFSATS